MKLNIGRSLLANRVMAFLNFFHIHKVRGIQRFFGYFSSNARDRNKIKTLLLDYQELLNKDNKRLFNLLGFSSSKDYFF